MSKPANRSVGIVGTGTIGASWAAFFLAKGFDVHASDPAPGAEERLRGFVGKAWPALESLGLSPGASVQNLHFHEKIADAVAGVEFVQESGPEQEDIKIAIFREIDAALHPDVIISSSSSHLNMSRVQSECAHPERCTLGHPFNPPHLIPLVEVMGGSKTTPAAVEKCMAFYRSVGKHPIQVLKEQHGHVANRLQRALWQEAARMVAEGYVSAADVDTAICKGPGLRWGIMGQFQILNLGGGDGGFQGWMKNVSGLKVGEKIGSSVLTQELLDNILEGIEINSKGKTIPEMVKERDEKLVAVLKIVNPSPAQ
jgi:carnitine 3-dehydrogenase